MSGVENRSHAGRPRQAEVDERLATTVLALLRDRGPTAVTVEAVAAASGIAKTTIYRRHSNRVELLTTVLRDAIGEPRLPPGGSAHDKLLFALRGAWRQMRDVLGPGGLSAIVLNADPQFTELFRAALRPYEEALVARIREDARAGHLRPGVDAEGVVSLLVGAYLGELVRRGEVDQTWIDRCLELMWPALAPPTPVVDLSRAR